VTRSPVRLGVVIAAALSLLGLSACGSSTAGAAAVVDGRRITVEDVQAATTDFETFTGQPVPPQQVLYFLVIGPYVTQAAAKAGVGVSLDDARVQLTQKVPEPSEQGIAALRAADSASRLTQLSEDRAKPALDAVVAELRAADIELSPRYGTFDAEQITIARPAENWIATPSAQPSPSAP
jgi:hypothetical protein